MVNQQLRKDASRFEVRATVDSHFSWVRTRLSLERTLISWVRTAVSLIAFGFTIVQFFDLFQQMPGVAPARNPEAPRYIGLALIFAGVMVLVVSVWQYRWVLHYLWSGNFASIAATEEERMQTSLIAIAMLLILIGVSAFGALLMRYV
jgi:putative membrane protein